MPISLKKAEKIIARFHRRKIIVVGDLMLDRYIYGKVRRLSPEAPVPIALVHDEINMPGGAANVARNVKALGAGAAIFGAVGADQAGRELIRIMRADGIEPGGLFTPGNKKTTVKMRVIAERQQVVRVDWDDPARLQGALLNQLTRKAAAAVSRASGVILADYSKGVICQQLVAAIIAAAKQRGVPVGLDPKENRDLVMEGISLITPNRKEAFAMAAQPETEADKSPLADRALLRVSNILLEKWKPVLLVITLGAQGMLVAPRERPPFHVATAAREVFDVSGAGDTAIATMLLALASGADCREAAELANCASGVVVGKMGTATCTGAELLIFMRELRRY